MVEFGKKLIEEFGPRESNKAMMYSDTGLLNCNRAIQLFLLPFVNWFSLYFNIINVGDLRLPVTLSCASLAQTDAGGIMHSVESSVGSNHVIDPITEEESCQDGSLVITAMHSRNEVTRLTLTWEWSSPKIH
ncbi:hypothetical protein C5167_000384 [Papaver somniferum]|uniref:Uncharacterized protein n=1 Tax=Papaver somniferum TaxID=3469 RepID=A0A4Y7KSI0_PAPSO|nr:hypothetical protein C5167_000384 [Papaver somniferum]